MFARRPGRNPDLAPIAMGSHLDTPPTGGKFDGTLGVLGALEAMRTLHGAGYETNAPIEIVNSTNEEGSRFAPAMLASGVFAGVFTSDFAYARLDRDGKSFGEELERIGYKGEERVGARKFAAMFELHIEQGPILENEGRMIGIVQGVQGMRWYEVRWTGQEAHTGATPMRLRKNALLGAARMIERIDAIAREHAPDAVGSVGLIENKPNSRNVIPGEVFFTVDFRHPDDKVLDAMETKFRAAFVEILPPMQLAYRETRILEFAGGQVRPRSLSNVCGSVRKRLVSFPRNHLRRGARRRLCRAGVAPTTMIFVPCLGGISHNEAKSTSFDECAAGAQVLLNAILEFDRRLG